MLLHASCVSLGGKGVLLMGDSGSGKSDLALRLIDRGAQLVSDDQVEIVAVKKQLLASPPPAIEGLLEVRGIGIFQMGFMDKVPLALVARLSTHRAIERMPDEAFFDCLGVRVPVVSLHAFDRSADAKIRLLLQTA